MTTSIQKELGIFLTAFYNDGLYVVIKDASGKKKNFSFDFFPYLYIVSKKPLQENDFSLLSSSLTNLLEILKTDKVNSTNCYKLIFKNVDSFISSREFLNKVSLSSSFKLKEQNIPFINRFFIDYSLSCFKKISYNHQDDKLLSFEILDDVAPESLSSLTFDIEVLPPPNLSFPDANFSPIFSICTMDENHNYTVFFLKDLSFKEDVFFSNFKKEKVTVFFFTDESLLIESFIRHLEEYDPDLLFSYNGDRFDFNYISKRYNVLKSKDLNFSTKLTFHIKQNSAVSIDNIIHIDTYILMRLLNYLQIFNYSKLDLNSVYTKITGNPKIVLKVKDFIDLYSSQNYSSLIDYNMDDVNATHYLSINYLSIINEVSKLISSPIFDTLRISAGQMIEKLFIYNYFKKNLLIEDKPDRFTVANRSAYRFTGAFVKDPLVGLHDNVAVVDFRSYHISILMTYNISPETINVPSSHNYQEILGYKISKEKKGFVPELLEDFLALRISIKNQMKTFSINSQEYKSLYAKQYALKILLASTYGYMGFSGARWYCRPCLEVMYHLVRTKIQETIDLFTSFGYTVIYGDTDSCFIKFEDKAKLLKDIEKINAALPSKMSLETEGFFKSGLFVMSRNRTKGAKKKYVLLGEDGFLKIKGFEFVRRDWCPLVKDTQKELFRILLEEKDIKKGVEYVREVINALKSGNVPVQRLVIQSFIHKKISNYKTRNPAMSALTYAIEHGKVPIKSDLIEYVITNIPSKNVSDKARLFNDDFSFNYDISYYLDNQLLPSVISILEVFGISKDELLTGKKQKGLSDYF